MPTILITIDCLRGDHLSQYSYHRNTFPTIDKWLGDAHVFTSAFANGPWTSRSLPSLLTSSYAPGNRLLTGPTLASELSASNHPTAGFHSNTALSSRYDSIEGFETYRDFSDQMNELDPEYTIERTMSQKAYRKSFKILKPKLENTPFIGKAGKFLHRVVTGSSWGHAPTVYVDARQITEIATGWVREHANEEFFLWVHYMDPHRPYGLQNEVLPYVDNPPNRSQLWKLMAKVGNQPGSVTEPEWANVVDLYDSDIRYVSENLDDLFQTLDELGIWDDTNLILTADHGEEFGEHGRGFHQNRGYDELLHVPLFVRIPGKEGETHHGLRELVDVAPTILDFYDIQCSSLQGTNLFEGESRTVIANGAVCESDNSIVVRTESHKYIYTFGDSEKRELYNLEEDPQEQSPITDESKSTELHESIPMEIFDSSDDFELSAQSAEAEQRLRHLGYLEGE